MKVELTDAMKLEISRFTKKDKVSAIKEHIETTFSCRISYSSIYNEFRRQNPRFGPMDCKNFLDFLDRNQALKEYETSENKDLCKLLFVTEKMKANFSKFGDILILDSTYNTNTYSVPLVVFSGIDNNYKNVLFAIGFVNDESKATYSWLFNRFKTLNGMPSLVMTDQDLAIGAALQETESWQDIPHRLCSWHIGRNLRKYFKFIKADHDEIKEKIFKLPYQNDKTTFELHEKEISKFLKDFDLKKSLDYFENLLQSKEKWARPYHLPYFDADVTTTSRAESWNRYIKRYVGSKSELSDIIEFIQNTDKTCLNFEGNLTSDVLIFIETDPLVAELKGYLSPKLYEKQLEQYSLAKRCESKLVMDKDEQIYEVIYVKSESQPIASQKIHKVTLRQRISCSCSYFKRVGLICFHIFHICAIKNIKTIAKLPLLKDGGVL